MQKAGRGCILGLSAYRAKADRCARSREEPGEMGLAGTSVAGVRGGVTMGIRAPGRLWSASPVQPRKGNIMSIQPILIIGLVLTSLLEAVTALIYYRKG